jgi:hypothetical protein
MGLFRLLREWKEKADGTLTGPALETESVSTEDATITDQFGYQLGHPTDVAASRSLGTTYQNTTGNLMRVYVLVVADTAGLRDIDPFVGPSSNPVTANNRVWRQKLSVDSGDFLPCKFLVPNGQYYHVQSNTGGVSIDAWTETEAKSP